MMVLQFAWYFCKRLTSRLSFIFAKLVTASKATEFYLSINTEIVVLKAVQICTLNFKIENLHCDKHLIEYIIEYSIQINYFDEILVQLCFVRLDLEIKPPFILVYHSFYLKLQAQITI